MRKRIINKISIYLLTCLMAISNFSYLSGVFAEENKDIPKVEIKFEERDIDNTSKSIGINAIPIEGVEFLSITFPDGSKSDKNQAEFIVTKNGNYEFIITIKEADLVSDIKGMYEVKSFVESTPTPTVTPEVTSAPEIKDKYVAKEVTAEELTHRGLLKDEEATKQFGYIVYTNGTEKFFYGVINDDETTLNWYILNKEMNKWEIKKEESPEISNSEERVLNSFAPMALVAEGDLSQINMGDFFTFWTSGTGSTSSGKGYFKLGNGSYSYPGRIDLLQAKTKNTISLNRSFTITGTLNISSQPDGAAFGITQEKVVTAGNATSAAGATLGIYPAGRSMVYEIDVWNNGDVGTADDLTLSGNDYGQLHPHVVFTQTSSDISGGWPSSSGSNFYKVQDYLRPSDYLNQDKPFSLVYDYDTNSIEFSYAGISYKKTNVRSHFSTRDVYFFISGAINTDSIYGRRPEIVFKPTFFSYTDNEPDFSENLTFRKPNTSSTLTTTLAANDIISSTKSGTGVYAKPGDSVIIRQKIFNKISTGVEQETKISIPQLNLGGSAITPSNVWFGYNANGSSAQQVTTNISNGSGNTQKAYLPINKGSLYVFYEVQIPNNYSSNENITSQISISTTDLLGEDVKTSQLNTAIVAGLPTISAKNNKPARYILQNSTITDDDYLKGVSGRLYDEAVASDYSAITATFPNQLLTFTKSVNTANLGKQSVVYKLKDTRTTVNLESNPTLTRTFIVEKDEGQSYSPDFSTYVNGKNVSIQAVKITSGIAVGGITDSEFITLHQATAGHVDTNTNTVSDTPTVTVNATDRANIAAGKVGKYTITFNNTVAGQTATKNVELEIFPNFPEDAVVSGDGTKYVKADAKIVKQAEIRTGIALDTNVTDTELITVLNASGGKINDGGTGVQAVVPNVSMDATSRGKLNRSEIGDYSVTFSVGTGAPEAIASKTVVLKVMPDDTSTSEDGKYWVSGEAVIIKSGELLAGVAADNNVTDAEYRALHNVLAGHINADGTATTDTAVVTVSVADKAKINTGTVGSYTVTVSNGTGTSTATKTFTLTIIPTSGDISGDKNYWVSGEAVIIKSGELLAGVAADNNVTDAEYRTLHNVLA
ncbi:hypothetical protein, partial [Anaerorhabdus sp.]|uniref:hypothetical protein n=1 Tax=Anaerorhabdus sp. TaxID=1872524 RepID=UPI002B20D5EC